MDTSKLIAELRQMVTAGERAKLDYAPREHRAMRRAADAIEALVLERDVYKQDSFTGQYEHGRWQGRTEDLEQAIREAVEVLERRGYKPSDEQLLDILSTALDQELDPEERTR